MSHDTDSTAPHLTWTLLLACLAQFMVILDVSVVNVALPAIRHGLHFSEADLQWVVNAYTVTFAGFLLLGGRAADLIGRRRVFVGGLVLFSLASLVGGFAGSQTMLIAARAAQGLGGAVIAPASLSILTTTFAEGHARNRAVGIWGAMGGAGGAVGVLLGGVLTSTLGWRWILFINVPIGVLAAVAAQRMILEGRNLDRARRFDLPGALTATIGLSVLVLGIVRTSTTGWTSAPTLALIGAGILVLVAFLLIEGRFAPAPLMPLRIYSSRRLSAANGVMLLLGATSFGMWFFVSLYLQQVLGYSPIRAGLAFLPMTLCIVAGSTLGSRAVGRIGAKPLLVTGMFLLTLGLVWFSQISAHGTYLADMLGASIVTSTGIGLSMVPVTISAVAGVARTEAGLASALVSTARLFGGALGLAILAALATSHTDAQLRAGVAAHAALTSGFRLAFVISAAGALVGALIALIGLPGATAPVPAPAGAPAAAPVQVEA
jgi:EmrB/QacA subfamily drug resistance transporter